jgi:CheY-like chemotaxis protein
MPPSTTTSSHPGDADNLVGRILIADDNQQNRELLEAYLADDGHEILMAADGRQTLDVTLEQKPDLILLDIMMPKLSGYEVCHRLKENPATRSIPVLMVTALRDMGDIEKAVAAGADDFLSKPVHRLELKTRVRSLLRVRHLTNERDRLLAYLAEVEQTALR